MRYSIVNIPEIIDAKQSASYRGDIAVTRITPTAAPFGYTPIYVNAIFYMLCTSGHATLGIDGTSYRFAEGMLAFLSPLHLTELGSCSDDFKCTLLLVRRNFIDGMTNFDIRQRIVRGVSMQSNPIVTLERAEKAVIARCYTDISRQIADKKHSYQIEMIHNALSRYYLELDNILNRKDLDRQEGENSTVVRQMSLVRKFISLLVTHYKEEHTVPFYASRLSITPQYLTTMVRERTGRTVSDFIYEFLYSEARNLLSRSDMTVEAIAAELHFADSASFSKFFKRRAGISPLAFRNTV